MKPAKSDAENADPTPPALPSWKAFVIQLSRDTRPDGGVFAGRVEHLSSGRRQRFFSGEELLAAVMRVLQEIDEPSSDE